MEILYPYWISQCIKIDLNSMVVTSWDTSIVVGSRDDAISHVSNIGHWLPQWIQKKRIQLECINQLIRATWWLHQWCIKIDFISFKVATGHVVYRIVAGYRNRIVGSRWMMQHCIWYIGLFRRVHKRGLTGLFVIVFWFGFSWWSNALQLMDQLVWLSLFFSFLFVSS